MMKRFFCAAAIAFSLIGAQAATPVPSDIAGIWTTKDSEFNGQALVKGRALYLDTDGIGASVVGNGSEVLGVKLVVTAYNKDTNTLSMEMTESRNVIVHTGMIYDPVKKLLSSKMDPTQKFERRFEEVSAQVRSSLGLETKAK